MKTYETPLEAFADHLRGLRLRRRMNQTELALAAGLSQATISSLETARREPMLSTLVCLARALDVGVDEIIPYQYRSSTSVEIRRGPKAGESEAPLA